MKNLKTYISERLIINKNYQLNSLSSYIIDYFTDHPTDVFDGLYSPNLVVNTKSIVDDLNSIYEKTKGLKELTYEQAKDTYKNGSSILDVFDYNNDDLEEIEKCFYFWYNSKALNKNVEIMLQNERRITMSLSISNYFFNQNDNSKFYEIEKDDFYNIIVYLYNRTKNNMDSNQKSTFETIIKELEQ